MKHYAGALIESDGKRLLFQQRDAKPGITNPGMVSIFGGGIEPGEDPEQSLRRELDEELGLSIDDYPKMFMGKFYKNVEKHGEDCECFIYLIQGVKKDMLNLREGESIVEYNPSGDYPNSFTILTKELIEDYKTRFMK